MTTAGYVRVVGHSMWPLLSPGDRVRVESLGSMPRRGEILVHVSGGRLVIHRLIGIRRSDRGVELLTKGDFAIAHDPPIRPSAVLGRAVLRKRPWCPRPDGTAARSVGYLWARVSPWLIRLLRELHVLPGLSSMAESSDRTRESATKTHRGAQ